MSIKIQALPLPQRQARLSLAGPLAILVVLVTAAGLAGYLALRGGDAASRPTQIHENSGVIANSSASFPSVAALERAFDSSAVSANFSSVAALERAFEAAPTAGARGRGLMLAELRGVDTIGINASFPSVADLERSINASVSDACGLVRHGPC